MTLTACKPQQEESVSGLESSFDGEKGSGSFCADFSKFAIPKTCQEIENTGATYAEVVLGYSGAAATPNRPHHTTQESGANSAQSGHACVTRLDGNGNKKTVRLDVLGWFEGIMRDKGIQRWNNEGFYTAWVTNGQKVAGTYNKAIRLSTNYQKNGKRLTCLCSLSKQGLESCDETAPVKLDETK